MTLQRTITRNRHRLTGRQIRKEVTRGTTHPTPGRQRPVQEVEEPQEGDPQEAPPLTLRSTRADLDEAARAIGLDPADYANKTEVLAAIDEAG